MVQLDWQRQIPDPRFLPCLREAALKGATSNEKLISVSRRRFPRMATFTASFRILFDVTLGATKVRVFVDAVFLGKGRTELTLTTIGPLVAESALSTAELRLATLLVSRIRI
jgi:hypothetical protein